MYMLLGLFDTDGHLYKCSCMVSYKTQMNSGVQYLNTVYCKLFEVEKFHGFHGIVSNRKTFPVK